MQTCDITFFTNLHCLFVALWLSTILRWPSQSVPQCMMRRMEVSAGPQTVEIQLLTITICFKHLSNQSCKRHQIGDDRSSTKLLRTGNPLEVVIVKSWMFFKGSSLRVIPLYMRQFLEGAQLWNPVYEHLYMNPLICKLLKILTH